jgi:hypothetical protein
MTYMSNVYDTSMKYVYTGVDLKTVRMSISVPIAMTRGFHKFHIVVTMSQGFGFVLE